MKYETLRFRGKHFSTRSKEGVDEKSVDRETLKPVRGYFS